MVNMLQKWLYERVLTYELFKYFRTHKYADKLTKHKKWKKE